MTSPLTLSTDADGVSIVSATTLADGRGLTGSIYDPKRLACGELILAHPLPDNRYVLCFGASWTDATHDGAGGYAGHGVRYRPTIYRVDPAVGSAELLTDRNGQPGEMNSTSVDPSLLRLVGGISTVGRMIVLRTGAGNILTRYDSDTGLRFVDDIPLPDSESDLGTVTWDRGIFLEDDYVIVIGSRKIDNALCLMAMPLYRLSDMTSWQYASATGWTVNPAEIVPLRSHTGASISSLGPCSFARDRTALMLSTSAPVGGNMVGQVWTTRRSVFGSWQPNTTTVPIGSLDSFQSGINGGIRLHQNVRANPDHPSLEPSAITSAIPYTWTTVAPNLLTTNWDLWPVPKLGG